MPWEKSFDVDLATDKAIAVFLDKGYEGTSVSDLMESMGINKGSLYNAFGSKRELFSRALLRYDMLNRQRELEALSAMEDPKEAIAIFFDSLITSASEDTGKNGCLIVNTALELPNQPDEIGKMVRASLGEVEIFFRDMIIKGRNTGHIPRHVQVSDTATALMSLVIGLRVLSRGTSGPDQLSAIRASALRLIS